MGYLRPSVFRHTSVSLPFAAGGGAGGDDELVNRKGRLVEIEIIPVFDPVGIAPGSSDLGIACDHTSGLLITISGKTIHNGSVGAFKLAFNEPVDHGAMVQVDVQIGVIAGAGVVVVRKTYVV